MQIEHNGLFFAVEVTRDDSSDAPWDREDGHGPVSGWTDRTKLPGERVLVTDGRRRRFYHFGRAVEMARGGEWGIADVKGLAAKLGRTPTKGDIAVEAVEQDFKRLRAWCNDEWEYVGVTVTRHDFEDSLWGIESDDSAYHVTVAHQLAESFAGPNPSKLADALMADAPGAKDAAAEYLRTRISAD